MNDCPHSYTGTVSQADCPWCQLTAKDALIQQLYQALYDIYDSDAIYVELNYETLDQLDTATQVALAAYQAHAHTS